MPGTTFKAPEDDYYDDFDDYEATRRKNQRVLRIGASLAAVIILAITSLALVAGVVPQGQDAKLQNR